MPDAQQTIATVVGKKVVVANSVGTLNVSVPGEVGELLDRLAKGDVADGDLRLLEEALVAGGGSGRLAFGGVSIAVASAGTVRNETIVYEGPSADSVASATQAIQARIAGNASTAARQALLGAVRTFAGAFPYLLPGAAPVRDAAHVGVRGVLADPQSVDSSENNVWSARAQASDALALIEPLLADPGLTVVAGPAGAGKSTLVRRIAATALDTAADGGFLPLPVKARHLAAAEGATIGRRLWRAVELGSELVVGGAPPPEDWFERWPAESGRIWLVMLDAMDEVPESRREELNAWLERFLEVSPDTRIVATLRDAGPLSMGALASRAPAVKLVPLDEAQVREIARVWLDEEQAGRLVDQAEAAGLRPLLDLPLTATVAAIAYRADGRLPASRSELYEHTVGIALADGVRRGLATRLGEVAAPLARSMLEDLALASVGNPDLLDTPALLEERLSRLLASEVPGMGANYATSLGPPTLSALVDCTGLLRRGRGAEWVHAQLRDHLAACAVRRRAATEPQEIARVASRWPQPEWREVVLALFGALGRSGATTQLELATEALLAAERGGIDPETWDQELTVVAGEALVEAGTISERCDELICERFFARRGDLLGLDMCARVFKSGADVADAFRRFQSRPALLERIKPVHAYLRQTALDADQGEAVAAVRALSWLQRFDDVLELAGADGGRLIPDVLEAVSGSWAPLPAPAMRQLAQWVVADAEAWSPAWQRSAEPPPSVLLAAASLVAGTKEGHAVDPAKPILLRLVASMSTIAAGGSAGAFTRAVAQLQSMTGPGHQMIKPAPADTQDAYDALLRWLPTSMLLAGLRDAPAPLAAHVRWTLRDGGAPKGVLDILEHAMRRSAEESAGREVRLDNVRRAVATACERGADEGWIEAVRDPARLEGVRAAIAAGLADDPGRLASVAADPTIPADLRWQALEQRIAATERDADEAGRALLGVVDEMLEADPSSVPALRRRAELLQGPDGEAAWSRLLEARPGDLDALIARARLRDAEGKHEGARSDYAEALEASAVVGPDPSTDLLLDLSRSARLAGEPLEAFEAADRAIALGAEGTLPLVYRALALADLGFYAAAHEDFSSMLSLEDEEPSMNPWVYLVAADVAIGAGVPAAAEALLDPARQEGADEPDVVEALAAEVLMLRGRAQEALAAAERAGAAHPGSATVLAVRAVIRRACGMEPQDDIELPEDQFTRLWLAAARGDQAEVRSIREDPDVAGWNEGRQIAWELRKLTALLPEPWLLEERKAVEAATSGVAPTRSEPPAPEQQVAEEPDPGDQSTPAEPRLPFAMVCRLSAFSAFLDEQARANMLLAAWTGQRAVMVLPLEDGDHMYFQANFPDPTDDVGGYDVKMVLPFGRGVREGVLQRILGDWRPQALVFEDADLAERFSSARKLGPLARMVRLHAEAGMGPTRATRPGLLARLFGRAG